MLKNINIGFDNNNNWNNVKQNESNNFVDNSKNSENVIKLIIEISINFSFINDDILKFNFTKSSNNLIL